MTDKELHIITVRFTAEELKRIREAQCKALETNRTKFIKTAVQEKCEKVLKE